MQDLEDEPLLTERVTGLDIARAEAEVTIRVPSDTRPGRRQETRTFGGVSPGSARFCRACPGTSGSGSGCCSGLRGR